MAAVSGPGGVLPISTVPRPFRVGFIPSCVLSSTESLRLPSCAAMSTARPALGFLPSSRRHRWSFAVAGFPRPVTLRPQVFPTSRRVPPPSALQASFIPLPRPGFPFRGLLPPRSRTGSSPARASLSLSRTCSPVSRLPHLREWASRLCSAERCVRRSQWLAFVDAAPLFGFPPPGPRVRIAPSRRYSAAAPLVVFTAECSPSRCRPGARPTVDLQRVGDPFAGGSSPSSPTCSRFVPSAGPFTL